MQSLQDLNETYAIKDHLFFEQTESGAVLAKIVNQFGTLSLSTYGAHILSYIPTGQEKDVFYLSERAIFKEGKAIRGGIPVCWPWFADDVVESRDKPHGFARNQFWTVTNTKKNNDGSTSIRLELGQTSDNRTVWPHDFKLVIEVTLANELEIDLVTFNLSEQAFTITQALHTYMNVSNVNEIKLLDLDNSHYLDKLTAFSEKFQQGDVTINGEIDRVYLNPPESVTLYDPGYNREITMTSEGNKTLVVWNPGPETIKSLTDIAPDDYVSFLCTETANAVVDTVLIPAGEQHKLGVKYKVTSSL